MHARPTPRGRRRLLRGGLVLVLLCPACNKRETPPQSRAQKNARVADATIDADVDASVIAPPPAADDRRCGYIDQTGKLAISRRFDHAADFASGLAAVGRDRKTGFIDTKGAYAIPPTFDAAKTFREGLAAVCVEKKGWGFIDTKGNWVIPPAFAYADSFAEGAAVVKLATDPEHDCSVMGGKVVPAGSECESGEAVDADDSEPGQYFLIDRTGKRLHDKGAHCITRVSQGLAAARWKDKWGYLGRDGRQAIAPRFARAKPFGEGWAAIAMPIAGSDEAGTSSWRWGFIDQGGRFVRPLRHRATEVGVFSEGLVAMEGLPAKDLLASPVGRECVTRRTDETASPHSDLKMPAEMPIDCGVYLDRKGTIRVAVPYCFFDDPAMGYRSFREFSGGFAEIVMQEPMRIAPFKCAAALMGTVRTFVDPHGRFHPATTVLVGRSPDKLVPKCRTKKGSAEAAPFLWE